MPPRLQPILSVAQKTGTSPMTVPARRASTSSENLPEALHKLRATHPQTVDEPAHGQRRARGSRATVDHAALSDFAQTDSVSEPRVRIANPVAQPS
jgi:hypothetical protein